MDAPYPLGGTRAWHTSIVIQYTTHTFTVYEAYKEQLGSIFALRVDMQNNNVLNRRGQIFMSTFGSFCTYRLQFLFLHTIFVLADAYDFSGRASQLQYGCMQFMFTVFSDISLHGLSAICLHGLLTDLLHLQYSRLQCIIRGNLGSKMGLLRKIIKKATSHYKYAMSD